MRGVHRSRRAPVTDSDIDAMAELTGDFHPVHADEDFATGTRFRGVDRPPHFFSAGLISAVLGMKLPGPSTSVTRPRGGHSHCRGRGSNLAGRKTGRHPQHPGRQSGRKGCGHGGGGPPRGGRGGRCYSGVVEFHPAIDGLGTAPCGAGCAGWL